MALRCSASLWLLSVASCVLAVFFEEIVDNSTFSDAPNQQTLPSEPFLGLTITNPEGKRQALNYCTAWITAIREALGTSTFDFFITIPNGSSLAH